MKFAVEHLEPELFEWCLIEYRHVSEIVGKNNLIFTNIKNEKDKKILKKFGIVYDKSKFEYFLFGGILGDDPAKRRTEEIIKELNDKKMKFGERNIGNKQMPTDAAVYVAKKILGGKKLGDFRFLDEFII